MSGEESPEKTPRQIARFAILVGCVPMVIVVVLLTLVLLPNFLMFNCRVFQSEAKMDLSGLYTTERAFYSQYGAYTTDLVATAWFPDGVPHYVYGFNEAAANEELARQIQDFDPSRTDTWQIDVRTDANGVERYSTLHMIEMSTGKALDGWDVTCADGCTATVDTFTAGAFGDVRFEDSGPVEYDAWTIDENRSLVQVQNDCRLFH